MSLKKAADGVLKADVLVLSYQKYYCVMGYAYRIADGGAVYFITCTVNKCIDIFTRKIYAEIIVDSLNYCVDRKGLIIY